MRTNEAVVKSPKWLKNFVDFEIAFGKDAKKTKEERDRIAAEEERLKATAEAEARLRIEREEQRIRRAAEIKKEKEDVDIFFKSIIAYVFKHYKECEVTIPKNQRIKIKKGELIVDGEEFSFEVVLLNEIQKPTFDVEINHGNKHYNYKISGTSFMDFRRFLINDVYEWRKKFLQPKGKSISPLDPYGEENWEA
jgi:hypothetical protein